MEGRLEFEGLDEFAELIQSMTLSDADEKKAVRKAITTIAKEIEANTPKGYTGKLSKIKVSIKKDNLGTTGEAKAGAFWGMFQEYGTSKQKANVGYFEKSVSRSEEQALNSLADEVFKNIK
ncbi:HK97-gp10 family putative phage morphogenesis protein [Sarcina ventriculi]|uniref:HK97-gp10 family putative phage morphogenesis protein n=1 Tax=Sarcina ventriculi TaxID=1267 RepID=UPI00073E882F|nr:HK97-gp10 family putative phage morphogenesis protein [Sarcina ventriculi]